MVTMMEEHQDEGEVAHRMMLNITRHRPTAQGEPLTVGYTS